MPPRLGVIGAGFHATTNILPSLGLAGLPIAALATRDVERSRAALLRFGSAGTPYGSAAELLADASLDAVVIVAQPADQLRLTLEALAAGKHVFVDKPLGLTPAEAQTAADAATAAERIAVVGFMKRHAPVYRQLRSLVTDGALGTLRSFSLEFACDSTPFCRDDEEFVKLAAIHMLDLTRFLFGEPVSVSAISTSEGSHVALSAAIRFDSGIAGTLSLAGVPSRTSETERLVITGDRGHATTLDNAELRLHRLAPADAAPTSTSLTERTEVFTPAESAMSGTARDLHLRGFVAELAAFAAAVDGAVAGGEAATAADNVATMTLCDTLLSATH
ncbi:Gfo/Idh/MocA family oxidoreductase [Herbiconiux sp.]|uniref:Gfo/Idh/MocA family protein n=1 Tax=Herbiconiux sp. TaxID=1871186 RepID=UPI0025B87583|nr:Gfo/Idh/MocA family oxidoreductase [Herbiconiux sp.]